MSAPLTETANGLDGQCCSCNHWMPSHNDTEQGKCFKQVSPEFGRITLWSDGCNKWVSNVERRTA